MKVNIKKLNPNAKVPTYAKHGDAGMDLTAIAIEYDRTHDCFIYKTGLAIEIPEGYVGLIFPRSSNRKTRAYMTNHVGIIDSGYRGEIGVIIENIEPPIKSISTDFAQNPSDPIPVGAIIYGSPVVGFVIYSSFAGS